MKHLYLPLLAALCFVSCAKPISDFSYQLKDDYAPAKVKFENKSEKAEASTWDFGDGNTSQEESPEHTYASSGNYTVQLTVTKGAKMKTKSYQVFVPPPKDCLVEINTSYGKMIVKLYDATPQHRDNFIRLVEEGYYEDLLFHRVIDGFMIQGGDPDSRNAKPNKRLGMGGPDYKIPAEFNDTLIHVKGALAAARNNNPKKASSGSQFYIVQGAPVDSEQLDRLASQQDRRYGVKERGLYAKYGGTPQLDGNYTVFGMVVEGLEVIDEIAKVKTNSADRPKEDVKMNMRVIK